ncbi:MAG: hypothetical protein RMJ43_10310 [Chloroherpetonaceae bacterium]|nr:hypothetical protein [Chthonomonadaceae bacterium]MDW8208221.1 hypothetical protein [Chloroherpetonaceae bacterium]
MGLFSEESREQSEVVSAPERMRLTRERGTRRLLMLFAALLLVWFVYGKIKDHILLSKVWPPLVPDEQGLTVVGTLDSRGSYERNLFIVIQSNKQSRVALTNFGWQSIFTGTQGELFDERVGSIIKSAIQVDSLTGYAMLEPFVKAQVDRLMDPRRVVPVTRDTVVVIREERNGVLRKREARLGALLDRFQDRREVAREVPEDGGGSASGREVEERINIPGENLIHICPVVLTGRHFSAAYVEEHPPNLLQGKTYTVHLSLTPEGRSRFYQWSRDHTNESLVFVYRGRVLTAGRIRQTLDVNSWQIGPLRDGDAARELVDAVNRRVGV